MAPARRNKKENGNAAAAPQQAGGGSAPAAAPEDATTPDFAFFRREVLTADFFAEYWEKRHKHFKSVRRNFLPSVFSTDRFVRNLLSPATVKIYDKKAQDANAETLDHDPLRAYLAGSSLVHNQADRLDPVLLQFCQWLATEFRRWDLVFFHHVFCVYYLTPPNSQAVRAHTDDQDVFILQVWGSKKWHLWEADPLLIYTEEMMGKTEPVPTEKMEKDRYLGSVLLEAGDVLYLPRGVIHEAENIRFSAKAACGSLHFTITVPSCDYCFGPLLCNYLRTFKGNACLVDNLKLENEEGRGAGTGIASYMARLRERFSFADVIAAYERKMRVMNEKQSAPPSSSSSTAFAPPARARGGAPAGGLTSGGSSSLPTSAAHQPQDVDNDNKVEKEQKEVAFSDQVVRFPANIKYRSPRAGNVVQFQRVGTEQTLQMTVEPSAVKLLDRIEKTSARGKTRVRDLFQAADDEFEAYCILNVFVNKQCLELLPPT